MARLSSGTISRRTVEALPIGDREAVFWDHELSGFGVRVYPSGAKVYLVQTRSGGRSRRVTIGRHGVLSAEQARRKAAQIIARIKAGEEPARAASLQDSGPTIAEVAERYMREHVAVRCKPTTARGCRYTLDRYLLPVFGARPLGTIGREEIAALQYRLHETPSMANRVIDLLSRLFNMAEAWGHGPEGGNPCRFVQRYMREHVAVRCKPTTARGCRYTLDRYLLPVFGARPLGTIGREEIAALQYRLHETPSMANRVIDLLSRLFNMAEAWGHAPEGGNPCRFVQLFKYKERSCERFLCEEEFRRLGRVLDEVEGEGKVSASAVTAIRLLMLTGCRRGEIVTLRWEDVDLEAGEVRLPDTKTGARQVALSPAAVGVLSAIPRVANNSWVIGGRKPGTRLANLNASWLVVRARAGLDDVRLHDLRHSFASRALALGESLTMIGKLLGHRKVQTTARYAHLAQDSVKASAARVAESLRADMASDGAPLGLG